MCKQSDLREQNNQNIKNKIWLKEPNEIFETYRGYTFLVRRQDMGYLCGYILLEKGAPYYGTPASEVYISVHGDITYSAPAEQLGYGDTTAWAIGFDCAHGFDYIPFTNLNPMTVSQLSIFEGVEERLNTNSVYRTYEYVRSECINVINQLCTKDNRNKINL